MIGSQDKMGFYGPLSNLKEGLCAPTIGADNSGQDIGDGDDIQKINR
jgi:hypothetical protein